MNLFETIAHEIFTLETPWPTIKGPVHMILGRFQDGDISVLALHGQDNAPVYGRIEYLRYLPKCFHALMTHVAQHHLRLDFLITPEGVVWNEDAEDAKTLDREMHLQAQQWHTPTQPRAHFFHEPSQQYLEEWRGALLPSVLDLNKQSYHQKLLRPHAPPLPKDLEHRDVLLQCQNGMIFLTLQGIDMPVAMCGANALFSNT